MRSTYIHRRIDPLALKRAIPARDFYQREQEKMRDPGTRRGWVDGGLCPFHVDRRPGSFKVHLERGAFVCYSCGAHGGDVIAYTQQRHGLSFVEALHRLQQDWRVRV